MIYREDFTLPAAILAIVASGSRITLEQDGISLPKPCLVSKVLRKYIPDHYFLKLVLLTVMILKRIGVTFKKSDD